MRRVMVGVALSQTFSPRRRGEGARGADEGLGDRADRTIGVRISAAKPLIRRFAPPSPRLRGEKGENP
jgi:hypothetical protein